MGAVYRPKKCAGTPSLKRANGTINMHSGGRTLPSNWNCAGTPCSILLRFLLLRIYPEYPCSHECKYGEYSNLFSYR